MVRLKTSVLNMDLESFMKKYQDNPYVTSWEDRRFNMYRYNWKFEYMTITGAESFWIGYSHGSEKVGLKHNLVVEFNPNKCDDIPYLWHVLKTFYKDFSRVYCVSADIACDMPVNILDVLYIPDGRRKYKYLNNGSDDMTYYFGNRGEDGSIKIYNKARQMKIKDFDLTRYEITRRLDYTLERSEFVSLDWTCLVDIALIDNYQYGLEVTQTERAVLYAVMNGFPMKDLSRIYKDKIKKILSNSAGNTLESTEFDMCLRNYFSQLKINILS